MLIRSSMFVWLLTGLSIAAPVSAEVVYDQRSRAQLAGVGFCDLLCLSQGGLPPFVLPAPDVSSMDFAPYTNAFGSTAARSTLSYALADDSISIDASAMVQAASMSGRSDAYSAFSVTFSLTTATAFSLTSTGTWDAYGRGAMDISLSGEGVSITRAIQRNGGCCGPADMFSLIETGVLGPGSYTLNASVLNTVSIEPATMASLTGRLTFDPAPVPVPAALWLLASGLAGLIARTRRPAR